MAVVTPDAADASTLRIAVIRMDAIQNEAQALADLRNQKESYENKLRDELNKKQKELEEENKRLMLEVARLEATLEETKAERNSSTVPGKKR